MSYKQRGDEMFVFQFQMQRGDEMFILWNADTFFFSNLFNQQISFLDHTSEAMYDSVHSIILGEEIISSGLVLIKADSTLPTRHVTLHPCV